MNIPWYDSNSAWKPHENDFDHSVYYIIYTPFLRKLMLWISFHLEWTYEIQYTLSHSLPKFRRVDSITSENHNFCRRPGKWTRQMLQFSIYSCFLLTLPHMGDFEQLHTWGGALCAPPPIFWVCSTNAKKMKISEMMYHCTWKLYAKNQNRNICIWKLMTP